MSVFGTATLGGSSCDNGVVVGFSNRSNGIGRGRGRGQRLQEITVRTIKRENNFNTANLNLFQQVEHIANFGVDVDVKETIKVVNGEGEQRELREDDTTDGICESEKAGSDYPKSRLRSAGAKKFRIENQKLQLLPIPHESNEVLEENDMEFYGDEFLGHDEYNNNAEDQYIDLKPVLPRRCNKKDGRFYLDTIGQLRLPLGVQMPTRLLCIDSQDILYLRYEERQDEHEGKEKRVQTLHSLLRDMKSFYSKFDNQTKHCIGQDRWFPRLGEVVVVKVQKHQRTFGAEQSKTGNFMRHVYQRALVRSIVVEGGINVELLDDYGLGGVLFKDVFRIIERFTVIPAQLFVCELAETGLFNARSMVHKILMDYPIEDVWPDCRMVHVNTTWFGEVSEKNTPLVEILIQLCSQKSLSLKSYVYQNITTFHTPFVHLTKPHTRCRALGSDDGGFLWINFVDDDHLINTIKFVLDKLVPHYYNLLEYLHLTVNMIFPTDDEERFKINKKKIYAVVLPDLHKSAELGIKSMYRVTIQKIDRKTNRVKVSCIDHHAIHEVNSWDLVPMYNLYPELSYFAPLAFKVHLYSIKKLDSSNDEVKELLYGEELRVQLVREWPGNAFPPEVYIDGAASAELDCDDDKMKATLLRGLNRKFVETGLAEQMSVNEMQKWSDLITEFSVGVQEDVSEEKKLFGTAEERRMEERKKLVAVHTFQGADYKFNWDSRDAALSCQNSIHSSSCSENLQRRQEQQE